MAWLVLFVTGAGLYVASLYLCYAYGGWPAVAGLLLWRCAGGIFRYLEHR